MSARPRFPSAPCAKISSRPSSARCEPCRSARSWLPITRSTACRATPIAGCCTTCCRADGVIGAREAAGRAMVLLRNENGTLPLDAARIHRMAVIGTHARDTPIGGYSDVPRHVVSVLEAMQEEARGHFEVDYAEGVRITEQHVWA